jgi:secreted trypsin-like serine protease
MLGRSNMKRWIAGGALAVVVSAPLAFDAFAQSSNNGSGTHVNAWVTRGIGRVGPSNPGARIINGEDAKAGDWPWQVALKRRSAAEGKHSFVCGGSVVGEHWILTAGHCVTDGEGKAMTPDSFLVLEGTQDIKVDSSGQVLHVKRVVPHESYSAKTLENDIALLEVVESARSAPVPYADGKNAALEQPGNVATVTGWGLQKPIHYENSPNGGVVALDAETRKPISGTDMETVYLTNKLKQLAMPLVETGQCAAQYKPKSYGVTIDNRVLCAGLPPEKKADACHGDSGGPLVVNDGTGFVQVGVVSLGDPDCVVEGLPGIYTRVAAFEPWLKRMTGINQEAPPPVQETQAVVENSVQGENPAGLQVSFVEGDSVRMGQKVHFRVTAQRPGFLVLFDASPDGTITQIYPNPYSLRGPLGSRTVANKLDAPKPLVVPDASNPYDAWEFTVEEKRGLGKILAVLSDQPIQELQIATDQQGGNVQRQLNTFDTRAKVLSLLGTLSTNVKNDLADKKRDLSSNPASTPHFSVAITGYRVD